LRLQQGDPAEAPDYLDCLWNRAILYRTTRQSVDLAIGDITDSSRQSPTIPPLLPAGRSLRRQGRTRTSRYADYGKAIQLKPIYPEAYNNRGTVYEAEGQRDPAIADFSIAIQLKQTDYCLAISTAAMSTARPKQYDLAIADYSKAIQVQAESGTAFYGRGIAYQGKGDNAKALADFTAPRRSSRRPQPPRQRPSPQIGDVQAKLVGRQRRNPRLYQNCGGGHDKCRQSGERRDHGGAARQARRAGHRQQRPMQRAGASQSGRRCQSRRRFAEGGRLPGDGRRQSRPCRFPERAARLPASAPTAPTGRSSTYAGHGLEMGGHQLPRPPTRRRACWKTAMSPTRRWRSTGCSPPSKAPRAFGWFVLDACRNNPFLNTMKKRQRPPGRGRSAVASASSSRTDADAGRLFGQGRQHRIRRQPAANSPFAKGLRQAGGPSPASKSASSSALVRATTSSQRRARSRNRSSTASLPGTDFFFKPPIVAQR